MITPLVLLCCCVDDFTTEFMKGIATVSLLTTRFLARHSTFDYYVFPFLDFSCKFVLQALNRSVFSRSDFSVTIISARSSLSVLEGSLISFSSANCTSTSRAYNDFTRSSAT